jgi:hypothetical protein
VVDKLIQPDALASFTSQSVANLVWAYGTLGVPNPRLLSAVASFVVDRLSLTPFSPQELSNMAWAYAKVRNLEPRLFSLIARHVVQSDVLETFPSQSVANLAWAFATLGLTEDTLGAALARRITAPGFLAGCNALEVANLGWAFAVLEVLDDTALSLLAEDLASRGLDTLGDSIVAQAHAFYLHIRAHPQGLTKANAVLAGGREVSVAAQRFAIIALQSSGSTFQDSVRTALKEIGERFEEEVVLKDAGGYSADFLLPGQRIVVEVDGSKHFVLSPDGWHADGGTLLKRRYLQSFGYVVVGIPFFDWNNRSPDRRLAYLRDRLYTARQWVAKRLRRWF